MNTIDTTTFLVDPSSEQGFTGKSLAFLQNANKEMFKGVIRSMIGEYLYGVSATYGISIAGCGIGGGGDTLFEGFIFFNGELYYTTGMTGLLSPPFTTGSNVPVFTLQVLNTDPADPNPFSDGTFHDVHNIRRLTLTAGLTGTGLFDYSRLVRYSLKDRTNTEIVCSGYTTSTSGQEPVTGLTFTTPATSNRNYKFSFVGAVEYSTTFSFNEGGILTIRNATTNTDIATVLSSYGQGNNATGNTIHSPIVVMHTPGILTPSTTIIVTLQQFRSGGFQPTLTGVFIIEEIPLT